MRQWAFTLGVIASLSAFGEPTGHGRHERLYSLSDADRLASVQEIIDGRSERERGMFRTTIRYLKPDTDWVIDINPSLLRSYLLREWVDSGAPVNVDAEGASQERALLDEATRGIDSLTIELPLAGRDGVREITFYVDTVVPRKGARKQRGRGTIGFNWVGISSEGHKLSLTASFRDLTAGDIGFSKDLRAGEISTDYSALIDIDDNRYWITHMPGTGEHLLYQDDQERRRQVAAKEREAIRRGERTWADNFDFGLKDRDTSWRNYEGPVQTYPRSDIEVKPLEPVEEIPPPPPPPSRDQLPPLPKPR